MPDAEPGADVGVVLSGWAVDVTGALAVELVGGGADEITGCGPVCSVVVQPLSASTAAANTPARIVARRVMAPVCPRKHENLEP